MYYKRFWTYINLFRNKSRTLMYAKQYLFCLILFLISTGCTRQKQIQQLPEIVKTYELGNLDIKSGSCHPIEETRTFIHAADMFVYHDSILIVLNKPTASHVLELYNLKSKEIISKHILFGNGPKEMLNCKADLYNNILLVRDFVRMNYITINLNDLLINPEYDIVLKSYKSKLPIYNLYPINDDILFLNPYCYEDSEVPISNTEPRFFYNQRKFNLKDLYNSCNVAQGMMACNFTDSLIVFASYYYPELEIYNFELSPKAFVYGPKRMDINVVIREREIIFKGYIPLSYRGMTCDDTCIYTMFKGSDNSIDNFCYLIKYNWDGTMLEIYQIENNSLSTLSKSMFPDKFYCVGNDEFGKVLYEINLNNSYEESN